MLRIPDDTLDRWIREDLPYLDLTTHTLGLHTQPGRMGITARGDITACGTEEVVRILEKLGAVAHPGFIPSGTAVRAGSQLLLADGSAESLHAAWKVCANILEHASGIATRTRRLVDLANAAAPVGRHISVAVTRKGFPGTKELATKAVLAGGGVPHRLGLSETLLVFPQHRAFLDSNEAFAAEIRRLRTLACEKKLIIEAHSPREARLWIESGADGVQFDKLAPDALASAVRDLRSLLPEALLLAAGGINPDNASAYAATGVDVLVTSSLFYSPPADIGVSILPV